MIDQQTYQNLPAQFGADTDIAFCQHGCAIDVRLTRPKALNALTHNMALALYAGLKLWSVDETVTHVVISADKGEKLAFCAGGDIRDLYRGFLDGTPRFSFFRDEYRLNQAIATFQKPYIALMDGMVMGGGAGIAMHGSHRIVTENTRFAMPEVSIGLVPDVGGSYVLPRLPNQFGWFLGLTGTAIGPEECLEAAIGTQFCASADIDTLRANLLAVKDVHQTLSQLRNMPYANPLAEYAEDIAHIFSQNTLGGIFVALTQGSQSSPFLASALKRMKKASPFSLCLAFEQLKRGVQMSLQEALIMEYRLVSTLLQGPDLYEGIRAAIIDRTMPPLWQHRSIAEVDSAFVAASFAALPQGDLTFEV